jgi:hypothetical protein
MADQPDFEERIEAALAANIPDLYGNAFVTTLGAADVLVVIERNGRPVARLNLPWALAKTLGHSLVGAVATIEEKANIKIPTTQEMDQAFGEG